MTGGRGRAPFWADSCAGFLQSVGLCSPKAGALLHPSPFLLPGLAVNPRTRQDPEWGTAFQHRLLSLELQQSDEFPVTGTPPAAPQKPPPEEGGRRAGLTLASLLDARKPGGRREAGQGSHISSRHARPPAAPASSHTRLGCRKQARARRQARALGPQLGAAGELDCARLKMLAGCM